MDGNVLVNPCLCLLHIIVNSHEDRLLHNMKEKGRKCLFVFLYCHAVVGVAKSNRGGATGAWEYSAVPSYH